MYTYHFIAGDISAGCGLWHWLWRSGFLGVLYFAWLSLPSSLLSNILLPFPGPSLVVLLPVFSISFLLALVVHA